MGSLYAELTYISIELFEKPRIPIIRPYPHYACGVLSCCLVPASLAFFISLESSPASAIPCNEAVLVRLD
jgi:hypothetical protein